MRFKSDLKVMSINEEWYHLFLDMMFEWGVINYDQKR